MDFFVERLVVGQLQTNCYVVCPTDTEDAIVIDPGAEYDKIKSAVDALNRKVSAVLLTHCHFDHCSAAAKLQEEGATIYMGAKEASVKDDEKISLAVWFPFSKYSADNRLIDGDFEISGLKITVFNTPGHTPGGVTYKIGDKLFTGDTLFCESYGRTDFCGGNFQALVASVRMLFELSGDYDVMPGHGEPSRLEYERKHNPIRNYINA